MKKLFVLILIVFLSTTVGAYEVVDDVGRSYDPMKLGDVFAKLGSGEKLSPAEIEFLRLQMNNVQNTTAITGGWIGSDGQPNFSLLHSDFGEFGFHPSRGICARLSVAQTIEDTTYTLVTNLDTPVTVLQYSPDVVFIPEENGFMLKKYGRYIITGGISWENVAGGDRGLDLLPYTAAGVWTSYTLPISWVAAGTAKTHQTFTYILAPDPIITPDLGNRIYKFRVYQDSGFDVDIQTSYTIFCVFRIH